MLTTTRAPAARSDGRSSATHVANPGPCRPTLLSMPAPTSCTRGAALPGHGSTESDLTTTAPRSPSAPYSDSSVPCPDVPDAVITGLARRRLPTLVASLAAPRASGAALTAWPSRAAGGDPGARAPASGYERASAMPAAAARAAASVVRQGTLCATEAVRMCWPSARGPRPRGVLTTSCTLPCAMSSTASDATPSSPTLATRVSTTRPCARRYPAVPSVAAMEKPSALKARATPSPPGLSRSASDRNTVPVSGRRDPGGHLALGEGQAEGDVDAHDLTGRSHLGPEQRVHAGEAVEGQHRLLDADMVEHRHPPDGVGREEALLAQVRQRLAHHHREATMASGTPVALATNGTVRLARGLASST